MKTQHLDFMVNGQKHTIELITKIFGAPIMYVDGQMHQLNMRGFNNSLFGYMDELMVDGKRVYFLIEGSKARIAIDGIYLDNGKPFVPITRPPIWAYIFIVLTAGILIYGIAAIPLVTAFLGAGYIIRVSKSAMQTSAKVLICFGITAAVWLVNIIVGYLALMLLYSI